MARVAIYHDGLGTRERFQRDSRRRGLPREEVVAACTYEDQLRAMARINLVNIQEGLPQERLVVGHVIRLPAAPAYSDPAYYVVLSLTPLRLMRVFGSYIPWLRRHVTDTSNEVAMSYTTRGTLTSTLYRQLEWLRRERAQAREQLEAMRNASTVATGQFSLT